MRPKAQRKFAQGAYIPPSGNATNPVANRRDTPNDTQNRPVRHHNASARQLLDAVAFDGIHEHTSVVLIPRLAEPNQVAEEPDNNDLVNRNKKKKVVNTLRSSQRKKVTRNTLCCTESETNKKGISKPKTRSNTCSRMATRQKVTTERSRRFYMKLRSARSTVDTDFSLDDDTPLMHYINKTKQNSKKNEIQQKVISVTNKDSSVPPPVQQMETDDRVMPSTSRYQPQVRIQALRLAATNRQQSNDTPGVNPIDQPSTSDRVMPSTSRYQPQVRIQALRLAATNRQQSNDPVTPSAASHPQNANNRVMPSTSRYQPQVRILDSPLTTSNKLKARIQALRLAAINQQQSNDPVIPSAASHPQNANNSSVPQPVQQMETDDRVMPSTSRYQPQVRILDSPLTTSNKLKARIQALRLAAINQQQSNDPVTPSAASHPQNANNRSVPQPVQQMETDGDSVPKAMPDANPCTSSTLYYGANEISNWISRSTLVNSDISHSFHSAITFKIPANVSSQVRLNPSRDRKRERETTSCLHQQEAISDIESVSSVGSHCLNTCALCIPLAKNVKQFHKSGHNSASFTRLFIQPDQNNQSAKSNELETNSDTALSRVRITNLRGNFVEFQNLTDINEEIQATTNEPNDGAVAGPSTSYTSVPVAAQNKSKKRTTSKTPSSRATDKDQGTSSHHTTTSTSPRGCIIDAPIFCPNEEEFNDPIAYFQKIMPVAAKYGICKVIAPEGFKPDCNVTDLNRFLVMKQYIERLFCRWGPITEEMCALRTHLATLNVNLSHPPLLEGLEVNLIKILQFVQKHNVSDEEGKRRTYLDNIKKWNRCAEELNYTKMNNPAKKLDHIYVRYLLPYDALTASESQKLKDKMDQYWWKRHEKLVQRARKPLHRQKIMLGESDTSDEEDLDEDPNSRTALNEAEECVFRGRLINIANFKKIADTALHMIFPLKPTLSEIENKYWKLLLLGDDHVCVYTASIDTGVEGYGFSINEEDPYSRHPWNLKMLSENKGNVLRSLGPVLGVTVPTLHVGMIYSTSCWHRDPHALPWMEYMHSGPPKIWYGIPDTESDSFRLAVEALCPSACQNKSIWLPSDVAMIPPELLVKQNVLMSRVVQNPGEYVIVFPKAYSCSISTGYTISESVYFATNTWIETVKTIFQELRESCEPTMFSLEQLLISVARDSDASLDMLQLVHDNFSSIITEELANRRQLQKYRLKPRFVYAERRNTAGSWNVHDNECEVCRSSLYLSRVKSIFQKKRAVCLRHALQVLDNKNIHSNMKVYELEYFFTSAELEKFISSITTRLSNFT